MPLMFLEGNVLFRPGRSTPPSPPGMSSLAMNENCCCCSVLCVWRWEDLDPGGNPVDPFWNLTSPCEEDEQFYEELCECMEPTEPGSIPYGQQTVTEEFSYSPCLTTRLPFDSESNPVKVMRAQVNVVVVGSKSLTPEGATAITPSVTLTATATKNGIKTGHVIMLVQAFYLSDPRIEHGAETNITTHADTGPDQSGRLPAAVDYGASSTMSGSASVTATGTNVLRALVQIETISATLTATGTKTTGIIHEASVSMSGHVDLTIAGSLTIAGLWVDLRGTVTVTIAADLSGGPCTLECVWTWTIGTGGSPDFWDIGAPCDGDGDPSCECQDPTDIPITGTFYGQTYTTGCFLA